MVEFEYHPAHCALVLIGRDNSEKIDSDLGNTKWDYRQNSNRNLDAAWFSVWLKERLWMKATNADQKLWLLRYAHHWKLLEATKVHKSYYGSAVYRISTSRDCKTHSASRGNLTAFWVQRDIFTQFWMKSKFSGGSLCSMIQLFRHSPNPLDSGRTCTQHCADRCLMNFLTQGTPSALTHAQAL